jgi:hypothetical protein
VRSRRMRAGASVTLGWDVCPAVGRKLVWTSASGVRAWGPLLEDPGELGQVSQIVPEIPEAPFRGSLDACRRAALRVEHVLLEAQVCPFSRGTDGKNTALGIEGKARLACNEMTADLVVGGGRPLEKAQPENDVERLTELLLLLVDGEEDVYDLLDRAERAVFLRPGLPPVLEISMPGCGDLRMFVQKEEARVLPFPHLGGCSSGRDALAQDGGVVRGILQLLGIDPGH